MKKVLVLGAGMVVKPIVNYLLGKEYHVTVADQFKHKAEAIVGGHPNGQSLELKVNDGSGLNDLVSINDITVSLLPYAYHVAVARICIKHRKNMVTTSYVKQPMKDLDTEARDAGIILLNEMGLDPGIDHMSAMRIIDHIHGKGGKVEGFYSLCGALPAPEACDNPFNYKFSWSPKGVMMASNNDGKFMKHGEVVNIPTADLFKNPLQSDFPNIGTLEIYPNRDSLPYIDLYGIGETKTIFRGTFRHPGWCESLDALKALKMLSDEKHDFSGMTYPQMLGMLIGEKETSDIRTKTARYLGLEEDAVPMRSLDYLGFFDDVAMGRKEDTPFEITSDVMIGKMMIGNNERDMVVMQHVFLATYPGGKKEVIRSSMLDFGSPSTDTAVARTVALPAAIGVEMILEGKIEAKGVHIPVIPEIYNPVLDRLETMNIRMVEEYGLPETEILH